MIFLSHNHKDKIIVEQIAVKLCEIFGQDKVFYDSWSIQPGDGIIDKMNDALKCCRFFLFFVSKNSLQSNMVKLEWQNAIYKTTREDIKLIPIKIDDCFMPPILTQNLYIDLYNNGIDITLRQIVDVISGKNTFQTNIQEFFNLKAYAFFREKSVTIECRAEHYLEPISAFLILVNNNESDISFKLISDSMYFGGFKNNLEFGSGIVYNAQFISVSRPTCPGFPFTVEIVPKAAIEVNLAGVMHEVKRNEFKKIPLIVNGVMHH